MTHGTSAGCSTCHTPKVTPQLEAKCAEALVTGIGTALAIGDGMTTQTHTETHTHPDATRPTIRRQNMGGSYRIFVDGREVGNVYRSESRLGERRWTAHPSVNGAPCPDFTRVHEPTMALAIEWLTTGPLWEVRTLGGALCGFFLRRPEAKAYRAQLGSLRCVINALSPEEALKEVAA